MAEKQLMILRHAEAGGRPPGGQDFERGLTPRGRRTAKALGGLLQRRGMMPDAVLCSGALRARETWQDLADSAAAGTPVLYDDSLYSGGPDGYLASIAGFPEPSERLLLIAHNPSVTALVRQLIGDLPDSSTERRLTQGFRPCNLAVLNLPIADWSEATATRASLRHFFTETDLSLG